MRLDALHPGQVRGALAAKLLRLTLSVGDLHLGTEPALCLHVTDKERRMRDTTLVAQGGLIFASILAGASVVATRAIVDDVPPLSLAVLRFGQGALILVLCLALWAPHTLRVRRQDIPLLALLALLLYAIFPFALNAGLRWTEASRGSLMLATLPVWTAFLAQAAGREHLSRRQRAGLVLSMVGVAIAVASRGLDWQGDGLAYAGDGLILLAAVSGAAYSVLVKRAFVRYSALTITAYGMLIGTVILLPAALVEGLATVRLEGQTLLLVLFLGILGGALMWWLFAYALGKMSPTRAAVYINFNPLTAMILAVILLDERLTAPVLVGFVVVLGGVLLVNLPERNRLPIKDPAAVVAPF
jgi:drug/metabolite transporter (DMT)-like permease